MNKFVKNAFFLILLLPFPESTLFAGKKYNKRKQTIENPTITRLRKNTFDVRSLLDLPPTHTPNANIGRNALHTFVWHWYYHQQQENDCFLKDKCNNSYILESLISNPNDVNAKNKLGETPLYEAIQADNIEAVKLLLKKSPNINIQDNYGFTPLHEAAKQNNKEIVALLMKRKPNIFLLDDCGKTASDYTSDETIKNLIDQPYFFPCPQDLDLENIEEIPLL